MVDAPLLQGERLLAGLRLLCAHPTVSGHSRALRDGAESVASILRDVGLDCSMIATEGAPIVIGRHHTGAARTLLVYARYDVPPAGLRRQWSSDPFTPTLRNDALYARGAVAKAELVARAAAIGTLIGEQAPINMVMVVEGDSLIGSPWLAAARAVLERCDLALWSGGGFDGRGLPLCYTGVKGLLRVELTARVANSAIPASYAATVPHPVWLLVQALASLKSDYEEVLLEGFYDEVTPPTRAALQASATLDLGEAARREAWGVQRFIANLSGALLTRTELFSPAINISALRVEDTEGPTIAAGASAELDIHLVPDLTPERVWEMLKAHLAERATAGVHLTRLPGGYAPYVGRALETRWSDAGLPIYGAELPAIPLAAFPAPAALLLDDAPLIGCGLERPTSALFGPDEHVPVRDLVEHAQLIAALLRRLAV
ncbi:peptidase dimerization domain-containing protein [Kallotenue papyrolyticum]|uniref:peptidase dimerization domain-containing protein n=1 Tax=Kallotenue papyrolyticum TaxID=1325125 RepID=UPI000478542A|nr:peptidase dimerization domain-containing protein [Kallotenue papyrolyticum]